MASSQHSKVWFSPHGTEWEAETYEEALEMERDSLVEQLQAAEKRLARWEAQHDPARLVHSERFQDDLDGLRLAVESADDYKLPDDHEIKFTIAFARELYGLLEQLEALLTCDCVHDPASSRACPKCGRRAVAYPASSPPFHEDGTPCPHVWKPTLDGNDYACVNCGAFKSRGVSAPASGRLDLPVERTEDGKMIVRGLSIGGPDLSSGQNQDTKGSA